MQARKWPNALRGLPAESRAPLGENPMSSPMSAAQQKAQLPAAVDPIHRVLLIESDPQLQRFWETALTGGGFQVAIAATPNDALHLAANAAPNLVFLGTGLDGSKAVGLLEALRRMSRTFPS